MNKLTITICGAGRTGHSNAILFKQKSNVVVKVLTNNADLACQYTASPQEIKAEISGDNNISAFIDLITTDVAAALKDTDLIIITVPANARESLLEKISPWIPRDKAVYLGAIPGFCGFDWLANKHYGKNSNVIIWGMKDVPHTAFELVPGKSVKIGGSKSKLYVATSQEVSNTSRKQLTETLNYLYGTPVEVLQNYLEITLTPGNPIMRSSALYGLIGPDAQWANRAFSWPICWWSESTELAAYYLSKMDEENQRIKKAIEHKMHVDLSSVKPLRIEIIEAYGDQISDQSTMWSVLKTNKAYSGIQAPLVYEEGKGYFIDMQSRAFKEDIEYGLALLVEIARRLNVSVPVMEEVLAWHSNLVVGPKNTALAYLPQAWPNSRSLGGYDES